MTYPRRCDAANRAAMAGATFSSVSQLAWNCCGTQVAAREFRIKAEGVHLVEHIDGGPHLVVPIARRRQIVR